ncbi:Mlr6918 protein [Leucobacter sp. 7(1)]|uniref:helix-turn-helix transcriptional regulator n=1 Tax=Leucobacter sp. 7(1) TaxID=1255613 RepID=UPI00097EB0B3|nr:helix-turn-helix transcriptional regulator [Leucobacter sp. 7(1)]SJN12049.1 Mlr6918 protein [Leucobacter sp. 7(1)]
MILTNAVAESIARGEITVVFRRWKIPRVSAGHRFHSVAGIMIIDEIQETDATSITTADAEHAGFTTTADVLASLRGDPAHPVFRIQLSWGGADPRIALAATTEVAADERAGITRALDRLDARSSHGPWTREVLRLIRQHPGMRAAEIARILDRDKNAVKIDIRKLKNLGLTRSLTTGYEISDRGHVYLALA